MQRKEIPSFTFVWQNCVDSYSVAPQIYPQLIEHLSIVIIIIRNNKSVILFRDTTSKPFASLGELADKTLDDTLRIYSDPIKAAGKIVLYVMHM